MWLIIGLWSWASAHDGTQTPESDEQSTKPAGISSVKEFSTPNFPPQNLYDEEDEEEAAPFSTTLSSSLGLNLPNPAPEIDMEAKNNPGKWLHLVDS